MQPTSPRLSSDVSAQPGYAPIAPLAVVALGLGCLYVVVLGYMQFASYRNGLPLTDTWLLFVPPVVVMLAFVARRQIRASEGTRTGERYANAAWWVAVVSGVVFLASLLGNNYTVQRDAKDVFLDWCKNLAELDAFNPKDPNLSEAVWLILPPGTRPNAKKDAARIEAAFADQLAGFRQTDLARVCMRNKGTLTFVPHGLRDWSVKASEIDCVLTATVTGPEGDYGLELPMRAAVDDKGQRRWQVKPAGPEGFIKSRNLTRLGWEALALEIDGGSFGKELVIRLASPGQGTVVYLGYLQPGGDPNKAANAINRFLLKTAEPLAAGGGGAAVPAGMPVPHDWASTVTRTLFTKADGSPHSPADADRLFRMLNAGGQVMPAGSVLRGNPDVAPVMAVRPDGLECRFPVEMPLGSGPAPSGFKGRLVFTLPAADAGPYLTDRAAGGGGPRTTEPPAELFNLPRRPWRLVRLETDLKLVNSDPPVNAGGRSATGGG